MILKFYELLFSKHIISMLFFKDCLHHKHNMRMIYDNHLDNIYDNQININNHNIFYTNIINIIK